MVRGADAMSEGAGLRVLHVDHSGLPGGGQLGLKRYAEIPSRHQRHFYFLEGGPVADALDASAADVSRSAISGTSLIQLLAARRMIKREVEALNPDLVVANSLRAAVAMAIAGPQVPMVYFVRQDMTRESLGWIASVVGNLLVFPRFVGFVANSHWTLSTVPGRLLRAGNNAVAYPLSGVVGHPIPAARLDDGILRILWLGRLAAWKGLHVLIEALRLLEVHGGDYELTIAGAPIHEGGRYARRMEATASKLRRSPHFLGHVDDVGALIRGHDVLVHTSVRPEPFGQVIIQGMANGLAIVASDAGGPAEVITHGVTGFLVTPNDASKLAARLARLHQDRGEAERVGAAGKDLVWREFSDQALATAFDHSLEAILRNSQQVRGVPR